ncbi:MAG: histidine--tRNA ligase [Gammaproteobacteria bacterium]|nr:histidine--tRNA ligase [Gammaproteobacteria bacterium]
MVAKTTKTTEQIIQSVRGMNDILPDQIAIWQFVERSLAQVVETYGYQEIRFPIVEHTELFRRTVGETTDVVEKEMYTFEDRSGDSLSLRPEGTASCVRAGIEHGLFYNQTQRWWYTGPIFRHDRPQKGRYRQFHQFGVEAFGFLGPDIDAEMILMTNRLWKTFGLDPHLKLYLNSLGSTETRAAYRKKLFEYFSKHQKALDADSQRRLHTNPMRILDSKNPYMEDLIERAPKLIESLDSESQAHFDALRRLLEQAGLSYEINPRLVRGLDYYSHTVFEWVPKMDEGAQSTVCGGGRYNPLVAQMGGPDTPAVGFALGMERLIQLLDELHLLPKLETEPHVYFVLAGEEAEQKGLLLAEHWRDALPQLRLISNCGGGSLKTQFKRADKSGAQLAFILAPDELQKNYITVKFLRGEKVEEQQQQKIAFDQVIEFLKNL